MTDYYKHMDRYLGPNEENRFLSGNKEGSAGGSNLHKPITSIKKLGATFAEKGRGNETILQSLISTIRQGTGNVQLALQTPVGAQIGGGISSIGKSQRQAIKEVIKVSGIEWDGLELAPSDMSNLSGFNPQGGGFDEAKRARDICHVKDAILFAAEIGAGGSVDIWSQEFYRDISGASFQKKDDAGFRDFKGYDPNKHAARMLVDERTGQAFQMNARSLGGASGQGTQISVPKWKQNEKGEYLDAEGNVLQANSDDPNFIMNRVPEWDEKTGKFNSVQMNWQDFEKYAQKRNAEEGKKLSTEEWWQRTQLENQYAQQRASAIFHTQRYNKEQKELKKLIQAREMFKKLEEGKSEEDLIKEGLLVPANQAYSQGSQFLTPEYRKKSEIISESIEDMKRSMQHVHETSGLADAQAKATWDNIQHIKPVEEYAKEKTWDSYAELALYAKEQTDIHKPLKPISVGPELGWPQGYGGHTDEFIEIIQGAREKMVEKMQKDSRYANLSEEERKKLAKQHIKGVLDTSHLSMWYNHFPEKEGENDQQRLKRFNNWYLKQIDKLAEADVVGSVQIVDSATGDHRHLAPGEGIFPTIDAVKRLREKGWDGAVHSEGHEEEQYESGKIQFSLWNAFGASTGSNYHFGTTRGGNSFGNIYSGMGGAAGYRAPPNYIVGSYSPSNDWRLWSDVPLE